jgi:pimeloyl-ACP methyl ester carboxylesterase
MRRSKKSIPKHVEPEGGSQDVSDEEPARVFEPGGDGPSKSEAACQAIKTGHFRPVQAVAWIEETSCWVERSNEAGMASQFRRYPMIRIKNGLIDLLVVISLAWVWLISGSSSCRAQVDGPANPPASMMDLIRYEPTGLSLLNTYERGKIPVVFIHGLWSNPSSWHRMIVALEDDPAIKGKYQFWTFGYSTGDPIPYSAHLLRRNLDDARRKLDPEASDAALDRMVIVGHSMGGLLSKMMVTDAGDHLWRVVSDRPFGELVGEKEDIELFQKGLLYKARPEIRRVIYIATPHQGSRLDRGPLQHAGTRLVRVADPLRLAHDRLISRNDPLFFRGHFRKAIPTSIDELEVGSPILTGLSGIPTPASVKVHSIIAVRPNSPTTNRTDGLVSYASAHLADVASEKVVASGHLCQDRPEVIGEVKRILAEHLILVDDRHGP